jgi:hypothetical protein
MQLLMVLRRLETERIEIGVEMAAHAIGADHHQRAHRCRGWRDGSRRRSAALRARRRRARAACRRSPSRSPASRRRARWSARPWAWRSASWAAATRRLPRSCRRWRDRRRARRRTRASPPRSSTGPFRIWPAAPRCRRCWPVEERGLQQLLVDVLPRHVRPPVTCRSTRRPMSCRVSRRRRRNANARPLPSRRSCLRRRPCRRR